MVMSSLISQVVPVYDDTSIVHGVVSDVVHDVTNDITGDVVSP